MKKWGLKMRFLGLVLLLGLPWVQAAVQFAYSDHLGSAAVETKQTGEVQQLESYFPFGEILIPPNPPLKKGGMGGFSSYLYTGQELDRSSDLYYYGARYYDPVLGRFTSVDPVFDSPSPYAYVNNNPVHLIDPDGRQRLGLGLAPLRAGPPHFAEYFMTGDSGPVYQDVFFSLDEIAEFEPLHAVSGEIVSRKQCHICNVFSGATLPSDELLSEHLAAATPNHIPPGVVMDSSGKYVVVQGHHRLVAFVRESLTTEPVEEGFLTAAQQEHLRTLRVRVRVYTFGSEIREGTKALGATRGLFALERGAAPPTIRAAATAGRRLAGPASQFALVGLTLYSGYQAYQATVGETGETSLGAANAAVEASGIGAFFSAAGVEWKELVGSLCQLGGDCGRDNEKLGE